jgi:hypothetical protein
MKVKIGPYIDWIGPYQILDKLLLVDHKWLPFAQQREELSDRVGRLLCAHTPLERVCNWIHKLKRRQVRVTLDEYDTWDMDETLRLIIGPLLLQLKEQKQGSPWVDDGDVPEHLRSYSIGAYEGLDPWEIDRNFHQRFDWVLDELIWVFTTPHHEVKYELEGSDYDQYEERIQNAYRLFGKYYQALWT